MNAPAWGGWMNEIRKRLANPYGIAAICTVLVTVVGLAGLLKAELYTEQPVATRPVGELTASVSIGQTFVSEYSGLYRIRVKLATYARENTGLIIFHLQHDSEELVTLSIDAAEVMDNAYYLFEFSPIIDSADKLLYFYLEAPEAEAGNAITLLGSKEDDAYSGGQAIFQGLGGNGIHDLAFRADYELPLWERLDATLDRLVAYKPSLWGDRRFYGVLGALYLVFLYFLIVQVASAEFGKDKNDTSDAK